MFYNATTYVEAFVNKITCYNCRVTCNNNKNNNNNIYIYMYIYINSTGDIKHFLQALLAAGFSPRANT
jgi:hypothetical protein